MAYNAVVNDECGAVIKYGHGSFSGDYDPVTESLVSLNKSSFPIEGVPLYYHKIVSGNFVEMTQAEKDYVDECGISPNEPSQDILDFLDSNAWVVDSATGMEGPFLEMQALTNRRELYNDSENPLYISSGFQPIVGPGSILEVTENRVLNLENIHSGLGGLDWHNQEVQEGKYVKPSNLLIYYGWPSSFNYGVNSWTPELVAQDMAKNELIVLGSTLQTFLDSGSHDGSSGSATLTDSSKSWTTDEFVDKKIINLTDGSYGTISANTSTTITATLANGSENDWDSGDLYAIGDHTDFANTYEIIRRILLLNPNSKVFGYVTVNQTLSAFQTQVDEWNTLGATGIFLDEAGYDYGSVSTNGRDAFNTKVDYVHGKTSANTCFVNSWNWDHVLGTANDPSYPNTTWNPSLNQSNLTQNDWALLESFGINTLVYTGTGGYEGKTNWLARGTKAVIHRYNYGINIAGVGVIDNGNANGQDLFQFGYVSACMWALECFGTSDSYYGSSSAMVDWWTRPSVSNLGKIWKLVPNISLSGLSSDVYFRYFKHGRLKLDFTSSSEDSVIESW